VRTRALGHCDIAIQAARDYETIAVSPWLQMNYNILAEENPYSYEIDGK
jgi:hypothetical protein